jgi:hypothetical protein
MVYALANDDGSLFGFPNADAAVAHCEGIDVADGVWSFFAEDGSPIAPNFVRPAIRYRFSVDSGSYVLGAAAPGPWLHERLADITSIQGAGVANVVELEEHLKRHRPEG